MQCLILDAPYSAKFYCVDFTVAESQEENKILGSPILLCILEIPFLKFLKTKDIIEGHWHIKYEG